MRHNTKRLVTVLIVCLLLFSAAGSLALDENTHYDLVVKQVSRKAAIYTEPSKNSSRLGYIVRNMAVVSMDLKNGFSEVQVGPFTGFVETKYLITPNENVTVVGIASVKANTYLVGVPEVEYIAKLSKGQPVYMLTSLGQFEFIKAGEDIGFVRRSDLVPYDSKSPVLEWVEMLKRTDIKESESKDGRRLGRANKGNWVAVLYKLDDEKAIVRHGEIIGVMSLKHTKLLDDPSSSPAPAASTSPLPTITPTPKATPLVPKSKQGGKTK